MNGSTYSQVERYVLSLIIVDLPSFNASNVISITFWFNHVKIGMRKTVYST